MRESRESIMKMNMEITDDSTQSALRTIKRRVYQEDNAFMRKMEKIRFEDMNRQDLQKIYKIALRGLKTRYALDKAIANLRVREHETMQLRAINNGLKYHEIFKRGREWLMQIREG